MRLDFVGIGCSRCGTSWIAECLRQHPEIELPAIKELHYFNDRATKYDEKLVGLERFFAERSPGNRLRGEYTPRYYISRTALHRIAHHFPGIKLIIAIRDPVDRLLSQHRYFVGNLNKEPRLDLHGALQGGYHEDYVTKSLYHEPIKLVFELFGRENVHIIFHEHISVSPAEVMRDLYTFLGIEPAFSPTCLAYVSNASERHTISSSIENFGGYLLANAPYADDFRGLPSYPALNLVRSSKAGRRLVQSVFLAAKPLIMLEKALRPRDSREAAESYKTWLYQRYFAGDVNKLEALLQVDLSRWKRHG